MTDIDQLLRDTLRGRAATVTEAPPLETGTSTQHRSRWLPVAATVAAVLVAGGGVAVWGLGRGNSSDQSGGGYARTCTAALPAAWKEALAGPRFSVDGHDTSVIALTPYGDVVSWTTGGLHQVGHVGLRAADGATRTLFVGAPHDSISTSVDGPNLVLSVAPTGSGQPLGPDVQDIVAVDLRSLRTQHLLAKADMPAGTVVGDRTAVVLHGSVYWAAVPRGTQSHATLGTLLAYQLATGRTTVVGRATDLLFEGDDPRGVFWSGGGVRARGVPAAVPGPRTRRFNSVAVNGTDFAWAVGGRPQTLGWADEHGDARWYTVATHGIDHLSSPIAVSGPFVFLLPLGYNHPDLFVIDVRTGAVADTGVATTGGGAARDSRVVLGTRADDDAPFTAVTLDTTSLPELRC